MLHLGGVGEYVSQIRGWSVHSRESGDLHTLAATCTMWGNNVQLKDIHMIYMEKRNRGNLSGKNRGLMGRSEQGMSLSTTEDQ